MAVDSHAPTTRRGILAAAIGGVLGIAGARFARPEAALAANGDPAVLGANNSSTTVTSFENTDAGETSLSGTHTDGKGVLGNATSGIGVQGGAGTGNGVGVDGIGPTGVRGTSVGGVGSVGIHGISSSGYGVRGEGATGVHAKSTANGPGLLAEGNQSTALVASASSNAGAFISGGNGAPSNFQNPSNQSGIVASTGDTTDIAQNTDEVGVYGYANISTNSTGVWGDTGLGIGVAGTGDWGVYGSGNIGVYGEAATASAYALYTNGKIRFAGRSGRTSITSGHSYKDVTISGMTTASAVIATLQTHKSGFYVAAVVSYSGKFRMYLNKTATSTMYFSYIVIG